MPITKDRPSEAKYFVPSADTRQQFTADVMPVIAYLDAGIYCHPIVEGLVDAVKIGYYNPPDLPGERASIDGIADFVEQCMPGLRTRDGHATSRTSTSATTTSWPTTSSCSARSRASPARSSGVGWRGTGYKFAPWVGRVLAGMRAAGRHRLRHRPLRPRPFRSQERESMSRPSQRTLEQRLADRVVVGAEGYVFELERRGYIKAGPYVPEVILDAPDALRQLHREFLRAGSDVMVALTYYAHREKLRDVGRAGELEQLNRAAVRIANEVAREGGALVAGNICNTWSYDPNDPVRLGRWSSARSTRSSSAGPSRRASTSSSPRRSTTSARR